MFEIWEELLSCAGKKKNGMNGQPNHACVFVKEVSHRKIWNVK